MGLLDTNYQDQRLTASQKKKIKPAIQGGGYNYLGEQEEVTVPRKWLSDPDHVVAELVYITPREKKVLIDLNMYGSLDGKPNNAPGGLPSLQGDMGGTGGSSGGGNSGGGGGGGGGKDYSSVPASKPTTKPSAPSGGGNTARENAIAQEAARARQAADEKAARAREEGAERARQEAAKQAAAKKAADEKAARAREEGAERARQEAAKQAEAAIKGGGQDMSSVPVSTSSIGNGNDARLDYITGEYLDLNLTPEQKEQFSDYREGVSEAISPSTKTSNKIISGLLSATLFPFAGNLYSAYIDANAMGYGVPNPFKGLFESGNITPQSIQNFQDIESPFDIITPGGGGDGGGGQVSTPVAPVAPSNNLPSSMVNQYFNNLGTLSQSPLSSSLETSYNAAKANINNLLGITPPSQQFGYSAQPYGLLSSTNVTSNPFNIDYLRRLGLI
jgi:hypothetical protein